jgi:phosphate:Na+ symporter
VALEAAYRAVLEAARGAVDATRARLDGESVLFDAPQESMGQIDRFLETLSLETLDTADTEPRLVRLVHAIDHLKQLQEDLQKPLAPADWPPLPAAGAGARALRDWLAAPDAAGKAAPLRDIDAAAKEIKDQRKNAREEILASVARQQTPASVADQALQSLQWSDEALQHCGRLVESLRVASGR